MKINTQVPTDRDIVMTSSVAEAAALALAATAEGGKRTKAQLELLEAFGQSLRSADPEVRKCYDAKLKGLSTAKRKRKSASQPETPPENPTAGAASAVAAGAQNGLGAV